MYLYSLRLVLPYFAGTGHKNYTRSLFWFRQEMSALNPTVHEEFTKGQLVGRRTSTFWSGVSPDVCIEQTLIASKVPQVKVYQISAGLFELCHGQVS